jgi:endogenous inhibitor of DNA gyrase (YacG/DUF329 family)
MAALDAVACGHPSRLASLAPQDDGGVFDPCASTPYLDGMAEPAYGENPCPICGKPAAEHFRPFCSARCKDVDLHRWFSGAYAIPAEESAEDSAQERDMDEKEGR